MKEYSYQPSGVCSRRITFKIDDDGNIRGVQFIGGCDGNTHGVAALIEGMNRDEAIKRLKGIDCRGRGTSCPDQLALALMESKLTEK